MRLYGLYPHTRWKGGVTQPNSVHRCARKPPLHNSMWIVIAVTVFQLLFVQVSCLRETKKYFRIEENLPIGRSIGPVSSRPGYTYGLATGTEYFGINKQSGEITIKRVIDREQLTNDDIKFVVKQKSVSQSSSYTFIEVIVTIIDLNDNDPSFASKYLNYTIIENDVPVQPFTLTANDPDAQLNGSSELKYSIASGNDGGYWRVTTSANTGAKTGALALIKPVDREEIESFRLSIKVLDGGTPSRSGTVTVNIAVQDLNDNHPKFDFSRYQANVLENATAKTSILQALATDPDAGVNSDLVYTMPPNTVFDIDRLTGMITLKASLLANGNLRELAACKSNYCNTTLCLSVCVLEIKVTDQDGRGSAKLSDQSQVRITIQDVNNHAPVIDGKTVATISEDAAINSFIFRLTVSDADKGLNGQIDLTYVSGNELGHFKAPFCILSRYCLIRSRTLIDKEKVSTYNLTFAATDRGATPLRSTKSVIVTVLDANDHSPVFSSASYSGVVSELAPVNSFVAAVTATDADEDENGRITYQISNGNNAQFFKIDGDSGLVTVNRRVDSDSLTTPRIILNVSASDHGSNVLRSATTLTVDIIDENDEVPTFSKTEYHVKVEENNAVNYTLATLSATDRDKGANGSVKYRLSDETTQKYPGWFRIGPLSGVLVLDRSLNREVQDLYTVGVVAYDLGAVLSRSSEVKVYINVTDVNDNRPVFYPTRYYAVVPENAGIGYSALTVSATDPDQGDNGLVRYKLTQPDGAGSSFTIGERSGEILVAGGLTNPVRRYVLQVSAVDGAARREVKAMVVEVRVANPAEPDPVFGQNTYTFSVSEDADGTSPSIGQTIGSVSATTSTVIEYHITLGDPDSVFDINKATGQITTAKRVDRDTMPAYHLTVVAVGMSKVAVTSVNITVQDRNDNSPRFDQEVYHVQTAEDTPLDGVVFVAQATDEDTGVNARISYSISADIAERLTIDRNTGAVRLKKMILLGETLRFTVTATDGGGRDARSSSAQVIVKATDVNDHSPVFDQQEYHVAVRESSIINFRFMQVKATDADVGDNAKVTYSLVSGVNRTKPEFGVFPDGSLYVAQNLDRETKDRYQLLVLAKDGGSPIQRTATALVHIKVLDDNDNVPQFSSTAYEFRVLEGKSLGAYIGSVSARDADTGRNADLMYFFTANQHKFALDPFTGEIRSKQEFDREQRAKYTLTVKAVDNGIIRKSAEASVAVIVEDVNDNSPTFSQTVYDIKISEDIESGKPISPITATDPDLDINGIVEYSIVSGNEKGHFSVDRNSGLLSVDTALETPLDRETQGLYQLTVKAMDNGRPPLSSSATVYVKLTDANNRSPEFDKSSYSVNIREDAAIGTAVGRVTARDSDIGVNAVIEYSITQGNGGGTFGIVKETGEIVLAKPLDYEYKQLFILTIKASNRPPESLSADKIISINVLDVNDNRPRFTDDVVSVPISENSTIATPVAKVTANDSDSGANGRVTYSIVSQPSPIKFRINRDGQIFTAGTLDRENADSYEVTEEYTIVVEARDQGTPQYSVRKKILISITDINDNSPEFMSPPAGVVPESSDSGTEVMTVQARDKDAGRNSQIVYSLRSGTGIFAIDPTTGLITLKKTIPTTPVIHSITVRASDRGEPQKTSEQNIKILLTSSVNSGLSFTQSSSSKSILETAPLGRDVIQLSANAANVEYYVARVTSNGKVQPGLFKMSSELGQMVTAMRLDRDKGFVKYIVEVYVRDTRSDTPRTAKSNVEVTLLDVNDSSPKFEYPTYAADCTENAVAGHTVTTVPATDADAGVALAYTLSDSAGAFAIDAEGKVKVVGSLDRETTPRYTLTVSASDSTYTTTSELTVDILDVNDEAPQFTQRIYSLSVSERATPNDRVGTVKAIDSDLGVGGQVTYSLPTMWGSDLFSINAESGLITLEGTLDFEGTQLYVLQVEATDKDPSTPLKSNSTLYINVIDENDNEPIFSPASYSPQILEDVTTGSPVVTVTAFDDDAGLNGKVHYSILTSDAPFVLDENGTMYTSRLLDREVADKYSIVVQAEDYAVHGSLSSTATVLVTIGDVNDNKPVFSPPLLVYINERVSVNSEVATLTATDADIGRNGRVTYSLLSNGQVFAINSTNGRLKLLRPLDREVNASYDLGVRAVDGGSEPKSSTARFSIVVEDANDNSPQFAPNQLTSIEVREDQTPGEVVLTVSASDADTGLASEIRYYIIKGDSNEDFHLDQFTGKLSVSRGLDYERVKAYTLTVQAEDLGPDSRSSTIDIQVTVLDWNDCSPVFLHSPYYVYLQEEATSLPVELVTVEAFDADSSQYNMSTYQLMFGLDDEADLSRSTFSIGSTSGVLTAKRAVDREKTSSFTLKVIARNAVAGTPELTGEATVHIIVKDINDHSPSFDLPIYSTSVIEGSETGQHIMQVTATDLDIGSNGEVRYALVNDSTADSFTIDSLTGWIRNVRALDREITNKYELSVVAYDLGDVSQSSTTNVKVYMKDINDNSPAFTQDQFSIRLRDPTSAAEFVIGTTAIDPDQGSNGTIRYSLRGASAARFKMDASTGVISAAERLSGPSAVTLTVRATDGGGRYADTSVNMTFQAFSSSSMPDFQGSPSTVQLPESKPVGAEVTKVTAVVGSGGGSSLYTIAGGNVANTFAIRSDGRVVLDKRLDYSVASAYDLWVQARNSATGINSFKRIQISVTDENDHMPEFEQALYTTSVVEQESRVSSKLLVKLKAVDPDSGPNGEITYKIVSGNAGYPFILDSADGSLKLIKQLDRESIPRYHLVISATDGGGLNSTTIVIVNVEDINDQFPQFESTYRWDVAEDVIVGSVISSVRATDRDIGDNAKIVYSLAVPSSHFAVTPTGNVTVKAALDRETTESYTVVVSARNSGAVLSGTTSIQITVKDINDNTPKFVPSARYTFTFAEQQPADSVVATISTRDKDSTGPNSLIRYQLVSPSSFFRIDPSTGAIRSKDTLTYDVTGIHNMYPLFIEAQDSGVPRRTAVASVNITVLDANDHAPQFKQSSYFTAVPSEIAVDSEVLTVVAEDLLDYSVNALVTYAITGGNGSDLFIISEGNGTIYVHSSLQGKRGQYRSVTVKAMDQGSPAQSSSVIVSMLITAENRYKPTWVTAVPITFNVSEAEGPSYEVAMIEATDADSGINAEIVYSINPGSGIDSTLFYINSTTGRITLSHALDYEKSHRHQMTLVARDKAFFSKPAYTVLTVNVLDADDNPPVFTQPLYTAEVSENMPADTTVFVVTARDADHDLNAVIRYSIIGDGNSMGHFGINPQSGEITTRTRFDYETRSEYRLIVKATNPHSSRYESTARVKVNIAGVNEFPPKFIQNQYTFDVSESAKVGYVVGQLVAEDADAGVDGEQEFLLVGDSNKQHLSLGRTSGKLVVAETLDRESVASLRLTALVKNPGPVRGNDTDTVLILINLDDANDSPKFSSSIYNATVQENLPAGASVYTVSATDVDQQEANSQFSYALQDDLGRFRIDVDSGKITTTKSLDREVKELYPLVVQAIDRGTRPLTGQAIVYVRVTDVNDQSPRFDPTIPKGEIYEGSNANSPVLVLNSNSVFRLDSVTVDDDSPSNQGPFRYTFTPSVFYIDENTGAVYTKHGDIDYEQTKEYSLSLRVTDHGGRASDLQAKVLVRDINDEPSTPRDLTIIVQNYGLVVNGVIGSVEPLDVDVVGDYTCSLSSQPQFSIPDSGCSLKAVDLRSDTTMEVAGSDGVHPHVQSTVSVKVKTYTNETLAATSVTRINGVSIKQFVKSSEAFLDSLTKRAPRGQKARLISMTQSGEYVDLYLVLEKPDYSYTTISTLISSNKAAIERENGLTVSVTRRNVCGSNSCSGRGECHSQVVIDKQLDYTSTDSLTLAYYRANLNPVCKCVQEYMGVNCSEEAGACISSPCMHGAGCAPVGETRYECTCTPQWKGSQCQEDVNECLSSQQICLHGGRCVNELGTFKCECTEHFRGSRCEEPIRCENRNPCQNSAKCIDLDEGGYECECGYGFYGDLCQHSSFGFEENSYMDLSPLGTTSNDIKMTLATKRTNALILFQPGTGAEFMALQIVNSTVSFTFNMAGQGRRGIVVSKPVSSGRWFRIHATRSPAEVTLEVIFCETPIVCKTRCNKHVDCYSSISLGQGDPSKNRLNTDGKRVSVGGVPNVDVILPYASSIYYGSFVGCIGNLQLDGQLVTLNQSVAQANVKDSCPRLQSVECSNVCGKDSPCHVNWFNSLCTCDGFYSELSCSKALINANVSIGANSALSYRYRESYRMKTLLAAAIKKRRRRAIKPTTSRFSLSVRTGKDGTLMRTEPDSPTRTLKVVGGYVMYGNLKNKLVSVTDGSWHKISLVIETRSSLLTVDEKVVSDNSTAADFLDLYVVSGLVVAEKYEGCVRSIQVNGDELPMSAAQTDKFDISVTGNGTVSGDCDACPTGVNVCGEGKACQASAGNTACSVLKPTSSGLASWTLAVIIVVAVVFTLATIFGVVCLTNYCRRRRFNHKASTSTMKSTMPIITPQHSQGSVNGGHDNLPDRDILASERPIPRSYNNMSPGLPPMQTSRTVPSPYQQLEDSTVIIEGSVTGGVNSDKFNCEQFYDFDESASIAPSDVDIRKYYKGYRKGDNMEMQMIPQHMRQPARVSPVPHTTTRESPIPRQYASSPAMRQSPLIINGGYDHNRQETPISQLQQRCLRQTPIDELNRRIAMEQRTEVIRRDSESSLTDGSTIRQPHWTHSRNLNTPSSRPSSRSVSRQNSRPNSRQQLPMGTNHISAQRQQDLNRLSHRSASSSIEDSDDDLGRRQPMQRNIYSEAGDSSSDESSNDSFTASEFEADEPKVRNDYQPSNMMFTKLQEVEDESDTGDPNAYRTTFSWDGLRNVDTSLQRFINNSDSNTDLDSVTKSKKQQPAFRWDHFLSWGPSFEKLVGVFADIAELPQEQSDEIDIQSSRDSEDYV